MVKDLERAMMQNFSRSIKEGAAHLKVVDLLKEDVFAINRFACADAAQKIRLYTARLERTPWGMLPPGVQLTFKLAVASICHQLNWDFLQTRLATNLLCTENKEIVDRLATMRAPELGAWLCGYHRPERLRLKERAALLRNLGNQLLTLCHGNAAVLVERADNKISGAGGFVSQLDVFEAYRADPLRKKSYVLVQDLVRKRIVTFDDENTLRPAIDYHLMRLYLRTGRVVPRYDVVAKFLKGQPRPRGRIVNLLRKAVSEALVLTAFYSGLSIASVNYVEWQLGRSVCPRGNPFCLRKSRPKLPDPDVASLFTNQCPFMDFCPAYSNVEWRKLQEPDFHSTFY